MASFGDLSALLADLRDAIEPYVNEEDVEAVGAAARAAVQSLIENGALDVSEITE